MILLRIWGPAKVLSICLTISKILILCLKFQRDCNKNILMYLRAIVNNWLYIVISSSKERQVMKKERLLWSLVVENLQLQELSVGRNLWWREWKVLLWNSTKTQTNLTNRNSYLKKSKRSICNWSNRSTFISKVNIQLGQQILWSGPCNFWNKRY